MSARLAQPIPHPDVVYRHLGDGAVLVHLPSNRILELNETGARIWELLVASHPVSEIPATLASEFDVDAAEAATAVTALVADLRAQGLVT